MKKIKRPTTVKEVYEFERLLDEVFFELLKTRFGDRLIIKTDQRPLTPEIQAMIDEHKTRQNWNYELHKVLSKQEVIEHYYRSGKSHRVQIPLKPLIMPQTGKAPSAIPYLLVSVTTCLAESDHLPHLLASKTIEQNDQAI